MMAAPSLLRLSVRVPEGVRAPFEAAFEAKARSVEAFEEPGATHWRIAGIVERCEEGPLQAALLMAGFVSGLGAVPVEIDAIAEADWLAATRAAFPPLPIGRRFLVLGSHHRAEPHRGRVVLRLDAGLAFGTGEHATTRLCLMAFEGLAKRGRWPRVADMGAGSAILAIAAARVGASRVLAAEIDPPSVRVARENVAANGVAGRVRVVQADGWRSRVGRAAGPYELVFANILARPLARMARGLGQVAKPGGRVVLSGLLSHQRRFVLVAHARAGFRLERVLTDGAWDALVLRAPGHANGTALSSGAVLQAEQAGLRRREAASSPWPRAGLRAWPGRAG